MVDHATVQGAVDAAIKKGTYPDRRAAIAGLTKQLVDYQKGALKGKLTGNPVDLIERVREELWQALLKEAGDEDGAARRYADELQKITAQGP